MCVHVYRGGHINHGAHGALFSWRPASKAILEHLGNIQNAPEEDLEQKIKLLFDKLRQGEGEGINARQLAEAMHDFGVGVEGDMLMKMMNHADKNHDGIIQWDEFLPLVKTIVQK